MQVHKPVTSPLLCTFILRQSQAQLGWLDSLSLATSQVKLKFLFLYLLFRDLRWYNVNVINTCHAACLGVEIRRT